MWLLIQNNIFRGEDGMNLKESYRYANYLDFLLDKACMYLSNREFITNTVETHMRSKANANADNEVIEATPPYDVDFTPNDVIDFAVNVISEKESLVDAIATAKASAEINKDNAISMNKKKQMFANVLKDMSNIKPSNLTVLGSGYTFNVDGNQVKYVYDVEKITRIDFDRDNVRKLIKKYLKEADEISAKLDAIEINTMVDFSPKWDVNDEFEDIVVL